MWLVPTKHSQGPERVPATRRAYRFAERNRERLVVGAFEEPSAVGLPFALDEMHGITDPRVGLDFRSEERRVGKEC